jgi:hypothetical protein
VLSMNFRASLVRLFAVAALLALAGCAAPTVLNTQWLNPNFSAKPIGNILVVAISKDSSNRRTFEDAMVKQLAARAVKAEPSYRYAPESGVIEQAKMQQAVKDSGATGVLLSRVVNVSQSVKVSPGMYMGPPVGYGFGGFYGFYGGMWASSYYVPPSVYTEENVVADTRLFESKDFFLVWSASTTTTPGSSSANAVIEQFTKLIADSMAADGLI